MCNVMRVPLAQALHQKGNRRKHASRPLTLPATLLEATQRMKAEAEAEAARIASGKREDDDDLCDAGLVILPALWALVLYNGQFAHPHPHPHPHIGHLSVAPGICYFRFMCVQHRRFH